MRRFDLTAVALQDIRLALITSHEKHRKKARIRYEKLIITALDHLKDQEEEGPLFGSSEFNERYRMYHLRNARKDATVEGNVVKKPSHTFFYEVTEKALIIHALMGETMAFARHHSLMGASNSM